MEVPETETTLLCSGREWPLSSVPFKIRLRGESTELPFVIAPASW